MTLTAARVGSSVTFKATADTDVTDKVDGKVLLNFNATTDADGMTAGTTQVDLDGGLTRHVYLMSDIDAPLSRAFGKNVPDGLGDSDTAAVVAGRLSGNTALDAVVFDDDSQTYRYVVLVPAAGGTYGPPAQAGFDSDTNVDGTQVVSINVDDHAGIDLTLPAALTPSTAAPTATVQDGASVDGSYAGVPGMYRCEDTCRFTRDTDTNELLMQGVWQFVPAGDPVAIADADYLIYGAWLKKPDSTVGTGYSAGLGTGSDLFDAVTTGDGNATQNGITALTGTATYKGHAAGYFAERHVNSNAASSGTFTATAELTANFDGGSDVENQAARPNADQNSNPANNPGAISGMINNFVRDDGGAAEWVVELRTIDLGAREPTPSTTDDANTVRLVHSSAIEAPGGFAAGSTSGTASGAPWAGEWGVQFSGNGVNAGQHPSSVSGTFGAQTGSPVLLVTDVAAGAVADSGFVGVIGGFGARKE